MSHSSELLGVLLCFTTRPHTFCLASCWEKLLQWFYCSIMTHGSQETWFVVVVLKWWWRKERMWSYIFHNTKPYPAARRNGISHACFSTQKSLLPVWGNSDDNCGAEAAVCFHPVCHPASCRSGCWEILQQAHRQRPQAQCQMGKVSGVGGVHTRYLFLRCLVSTLLRGSILKWNSFFVGLCSVYAALRSWIGR